MNIFFKKDMLLNWRDRKENIISLVISVVLITVLGYILPGWIENPTANLHLKAAYVVSDDEAAGIQQFKSSLTSSGLDKEAATSLAAKAEHISPAKLLQAYLANKQVTKMVEWVPLKKEEAVQQLNAGDVQAIVTIPEGFTFRTLNKILLGEGNGMPLQLVANDPSIKVGALQGIIDGYAKQFNTNSSIAFAIAQAGSSANSMSIVVPTIGGLEQIEGLRAITSYQYFTLAIGVIFAMYVAANTASKSVVEKREQVFQRILLSGSKSISYLGGKFGSTLIMSLLKFSIVVVVSHFILNLFPGYSLNFWLGFMLLTLMMGLFVAAMAGLFTAAMYRIQPDTTNAIIQSLLLVIGVIGGNFVPVFILPDSIQMLWVWTPNGLWLSTMIQWIQQESWSVMTHGVINLALYTVVIMAVSVWLFPKRGQI
ncbi:ABC transporter permease [Paenibacillus sp. N1-5-1-14]|uniref:ABC transporter permease n=1 Tax=Paenibacillus radicibacter TaxID=2972488 RepID=UPI002159269F|nr:ABC transporter permease [Paenibacillus radicibacter]MCR8643816.1 ABC transporter permease [Paenibacillus radicibacter]